MVKLLNTPFGNYGYVLNRDPVTCKLSAPVINNGFGKDIPRIRPSVYDARYLRTTDLSKGSKIMTVSDPYSYVKHGLLHNGQEPFVPLENPMLSFQSLPQQSRGVSKTMKPCSNSSSSRNQSNSKVLSRQTVFTTWQERSKDFNQHAGRSTVIRHHKGFAYDYAARRSGLGPLASGVGNVDSLGDPEEDPECEDKEMSDEEKGETPTSKQTFVPIHPAGKSLTKLNKLKSRRLQEVYTEMYEKMDKSRRNIIMEKVKIAEKIKDSLHQDEIEERKNQMKTSADLQIKQLNQLRHRYEKDFNSRVNSVYKSKSSKKLKNGALFSDPDNPNAVSDPSLLRIALPRDVYGLPEDTKARPDTVPSKLPYRFKPGKLVLESYYQTRNVLPTKFNNVWTQASPTSTPRKQTTQES